MRLFAAKNLAAYVTLTRWDLSRLAEFFDDAGLFRARSRRATG